MTSSTLSETQIALLAQTKLPFMRKHALKLVALGIWLVLISVYFYYYWRSGMTNEMVLLQLVNLLDSPVGPLLYIVIYALRPLVFFPATVLSIAAGAIFGGGSTMNLALAVVYSLLGSQTSAYVAYWIGRFFGKDWLDLEGEGIIHRYAARMRQHSFETVFIMRLLFLPYDLIDYSAGILRIGFKAFALATLLGSIPGAIAFVSFGASIDLKRVVMGYSPMFDPKAFGLSAAVFLVSLVILRAIKRREQA